MDKFWFIFGFLISVIFGITLGVFISTLGYFNIQHLTIQLSDSISIVNTYIVFISIIFILFTIGITIGGYMFSKLFATEKMKEIHQNIVIISNQLTNNDDTRSIFIDEIFSNQKIIDGIIDKFQNIVEEQTEEFNESEKKEILKSILKGKK